MDLQSVFQLSNGERASWLRNLIHSFGGSYTCLWTFSPNHNLLYCEDGHFHEEASSSSSRVSIVHKLFNNYKQSVLTVENGLVPGLAFRDKNHCLKLHELDLQRLASNDSQRQFYLEANIKTAVFLGCERGEIEMGMTSIPQNLEKKLQELFPEVVMEITRPTEQQQNKLSSPCSSQSMDSSPEYTSLLYDFPLSSSYNFKPSPVKEPHSGMIDQEGTTTTTTSTTLLSIPITVNPSHHHHHHHQHPLSLLQSFPFPTLESTDEAALTKAYLAILSSSHSSSSSSTRGGAECQQKKPSAFRSYHQHLRLGPTTSSSPDPMRSQTLLKRAIAFYRGVNLRRIQDYSLQGPSRPTSNQLHHMISERRRREKINESFQALRSLLPQGTKKDKASVLRTTKEYLSSLKTQLAELNKRNQVMETELKTRDSKMLIANPTQNLNLSSDERLRVQVTPVSESTSTERMVDLQVILRRQEASVHDLIIRVLEFLKQSVGANMVSMEAQTHHQDSVGAHHDQIPTNWVTFRLKIEGSEWDESAFIEAIQRLLADFAS